MSQSWITPLSLLAWLIHALPLLAAFVIALMHLPRQRQAAGWLAAGLGIWMFSSISGIVLRALLAQRVPVEEMAYYMLLSNVVQGLVYTMGLGCVVKAVFVGRGAESHDTGFPPYGGTVERPASDNPFSSPLSR